MNSQPVKKAIYLIAIGCLFLFSCSKSRNPRSSGHGIKFETTHINLGKISHNTPTHYKLNYTNTATASVSVVYIHSSCTCTTFKWSKKAVKPGKRGTIMLTYTPKYYGHFKESIRIFTSSSKDSVITLTVKGQVIES